MATERLRAVPRVASSAHGSADSGKGLNQSQPPLSAQTTPDDSASAKGARANTPDPNSEDPLDASGAAETTAKTDLGETML